MQTTDLIQKILERKKLSQTALAELLGVDRSLLNNYLTGKREPGPLPCLLLAALAGNAEEHRFWIGKSGLSSAQAKLLEKSLFLEKKDLLDTWEARLLEWWRHPENPMEESVKSVVEKVLAARTA